MCCLLDVNGVSGGDYTNIQIIKSLRGLGFEVEVLVNDEFRLSQALEYFDERLTGVQIRRFESPAVPSPYSVALALARERRLHSDMLFLNDDVPRIMASPSRLLLVYAHFPHMGKIGIDAYTPMRHRRVMGRLSWSLHKLSMPLVFRSDFGDLKKKSLFLANSSVTAEAIRRFLRGVEPIVLHPPVESKRIHDLTAGTRKNPVIVYAGRVIPDKAVEDVILAGGLLAKQRVDFDVYVVGSTPDKNYLINLRSLAKARGLSDSIKFTGPLPRLQLIRLLGRASVYVSPSKIEPFGISVVEAMAAGATPVVKRGNNGPTLDIVSGNPLVGLTYSSVDELASKIKLVLGGSLNRDTVIARALDFDVSVFNRKFLDIVGEFLVTPS